MRKLIGLVNDALIGLVNDAQVTDTQKQTNKQKGKQQCPRSGICSTDVSLGSRIDCGGETGVTK